MAATPRFRSKQPADVWSTRERLCLASSVLRSGDQNWVSVSRAIRPFGETSRPPDWFSQKNCALQYAELLEKVETPKRKRGERTDTIDTPGDLIVRKLTNDRILELKKIVYEEQQRHNRLKRELEMVRSGQLDEKLEDLIRGVQDELRAKEIADNEHQKWLQEREEKVAAMKAATGKASYQPPPKHKRNSNSYNLTRAEELRRYQSELSEQESNVDSPLSEPLSVEIDEMASPVSSNIHVPEVGVSPRPPALVIPNSSSTSPLLTSLLKSPSPANAQPTVSTLQASPKTGILGGALQGVYHSPLKTEVISPTTPTRGSPGTPMPFFNPSSALAAARQLSTATVASTIPVSTIASLFSSGSLEVPGLAVSSSMQQQIHSSHTLHSATSSAPTLSKLLEMPPSLPGKLPPLPVVNQISIEPPTTTMTTQSLPTRAAVATLPLTPTNNVAKNQVQQVSSAGNWGTILQAVTNEDLVEGIQVSESDLSQIVVPVENLVESVCGVEDAFRDALDPVSASLDMDMEAIVNEIMKEEIVVVGPEDSPTSQDLDQHEQNLLQIADSEQEVLSEEANSKVEVFVVQNQDNLKVLENIFDPIPEGSEVIIQENEVQSTVVEEIVDVVPSQLENVELKIEPQNEDPVVKEVQVAAGELILIDSSPEPLTEAIAIVAQEEVVEEELNATSKDEITVFTEVETSVKEEEDPELGELEFAVDKKDEDLMDDNASLASQEEKESAISEDSPLPPPHKMKPSRVSKSDEYSNDPLKDLSEESSEVPQLNMQSREASEAPEDEVKSEPQEASESGKDSIPPQSEDDSGLDLVKPKAPSSVSDSIPNSPVSTPQSDDQENLREYKVWKKAIMLVWRAAANHKFANVFLHPVTNDVAPGYHSIVYRPMDLSVIKKNIENGVIKTTLEFQRDIMLMFQNAIMYNSSDHDVFQMAGEMQKEVMVVVQDFLATQLMVQATDTKNLRGREKKLEFEFKEDEGGKRKRTSTSESSDSKPKKRRLRQDE